LTSTARSDSASRGGAFGVGALKLRQIVRRRTIKEALKGLARGDAVLLCGFHGGGGPVALQGGCANERLLFRPISGRSTMEERKEYAAGIRTPGSAATAPSEVR
jgi:hypothetical protein